MYIYTDLARYGTLLISLMWIFEENKLRNKVLADASDRKAGANEKLVWFSTTLNIVCAIMA